jgi:DNA-binding beta-propeller fold protein YncE
MATSYCVSDSGVGNCSYLAPLQTWALQPGMSFEFEAVLALGTTQQIRTVFGKIVQQTASQPIVEIIAGGGRAVENKPATECKVTQPFGIAFDPQDNMFICEETHRLLRVDAKTGVITVVSPAKPSAPIGDAGPARDASFHAPHNLIADTAGNLYIADTFHYRVRRVDAQTGIVTTLAGNGDKEVSGDGGPATAAGLGWIACLAFNHDCTQISISGDGKNGIRVVDMRTGLISRLTGLSGSRAHAVDSKGNVFITTRFGVRMRSPDGKVQNLEDPAAIPPLAGVKHLWADRDDNLLIADASNHRIRKFFVSERKLVTLAGNGAKGSEGVPGPALQALLGEPHGVVTHPRTGDIYIADSRNHRVLRIKQPQ